METRKLQGKHLVQIALLIIVALLVGVAIRSFINSQTQDQFVIISSTDMNGRVWDSDIQTGEESPNNLLALSAAIKDVRNYYGDRTITYDAGDLYQDSLINSFDLSLTDSEFTQDLQPCTIAMDEIKYDGYTLGNHEFDYKYALLKSNYEYIKDYTTLVSANVYDKNTGERLLPAYTTKAFKVDGEFLKVGIIGLENPDCALWDASSHYSNIQFYAPDNPNADLAVEIKKAQEEMAIADEQCDFVIVSMHNGFYYEDEMKNAAYTRNTYNMLEERATEPLVMGENTECQAYRAIKNTTGIDMFICGHDQNDNYSNMTFPNADGSKQVLVVNGAGKDVTESIFKAKYNKEDRTFDIKLVESKNMPLGSYAADEGLRRRILPYVQNDIENFAKRKGKLEGDWSVNQNDMDFYTTQTDYADFINRAQMWAGTTWAKTSGKTVDDVNYKLRVENGADTPLQFKGDIIVPDMSLTSIPANGKKDLGTGEFDYKKATEIYPEDHYLCSVAVTGSEIKDMLEYLASAKYQLQTDEHGGPKIVINGDLRSLPISYGINFEIDMTAPVGSRVKISGFSNGKSFDPNGVYCIMVNSNILDSTTSYVYSLLTWKRVIIEQDLNHNGTYIRHILDLYATQTTNDYGAVYPTKDCKKNNEKSSHWYLSY